MAVAWPVVKDRLVALLPTLPGMAGVVVYDGPVVTGDSPTAYVTVGWQPSTDDESAGSYSQQPEPVGGFFANEAGTVLLEFAASTGDPDVPTAFAQVDALQTYVQANQSLGVLTGAPAVSLSVDVIEAQNASGAVQRLLVSLSYTTRLT